MDNDEKLVANWLTTKNLRVKRFTKEEKRKSKTPDFRVLDNSGEPVLFCEVKTISRDTWLDEQFATAPPGTIVGGRRNDPTYNRLTDDIHKAVKQFDAVNSNRELLNVLAFVNHDRYCGFNDLLTVITGDFLAEGGGRYPIYKQFSHGRIKEEKNRIHLYYWKDDYRPERYFFTDISDAYVTKRLCGYFGVNPDKIKVL